MILYKNDGHGYLFIMKAIILDVNDEYVTVTRSHYDEFTIYEKPKPTDWKKNGKIKALVYMRLKGEHGITSNVAHLRNGVTISSGLSSKKINNTCSEDALATLIAISIATNPKHHYHYNNQNSVRFQHNNHVSPSMMKFIELVNLMARK